MLEKTKAHFALIIFGLLSCPGRPEALVSTENPVCLVISLTVTMVGGGFWSEWDVAVL